MWCARAVLWVKRAKRKSGSRARSFMGERSTPTPSAPATWHVVAATVLLARRELLQFTLERAPVDAESPRRFGDVAAAVREHALDVLPLRSGERRCGVAVAR